MSGQNTDVSALSFEESTGVQLRDLVPIGAGKAFSGPVIASGRVFWLSGSMLNAWELP